MTSPVEVGAFGIQGSGQHVDGAPDPGVFRELAQTAEDLGYDSIWAGDHISYRNPILDVVVALSTFAAATERITIGAGVVLLPLRHPSVVAKEFSSLDYVSGGRVILGVGVGGEGEKDFEAVGVPVRERGARTNEAMQRAPCAVLRQRHVLRPLLLLRGHRDRARPRAAGRPAALGRRPLGGGDLARGDAR